MMMKHYAAIVALSALTALAACNSQSSKPAGDAEASNGAMMTPVEVAPSEGQEDVAAPVRYVCDNGKRLFARYTNTRDASFAEVAIDGKLYRLYNVVSASGAKYATEQGPKPDHLFVWWTKGNEASWYESALDHTAKYQTLVTTCKR